MWTKPKDAQVEAFSVPDTRQLAFRLPGHIPQDRVHLMARQAFGHRAMVDRNNGTWVVKRRLFHTREVTARQEKRRQQRELVVWE